MISSSRTKIAHLPNPTSIDEEEDWCRNHSDAKKSQQRSGPADTQVVVHSSREQRESTARKRSQECIGSDGRVRMPHVNIDDVVQPLQENHQNSPSDRDPGQDLRNPSDMRAAGPSKPEEADREDECTENHRRETFFRDNSIMFL
jgi:hypothetical protein